jgi:hypothetical protein
MRTSQTLKEKAFMTKMLDRIEAIVRGNAASPPIARLIGFDLVSV